MKDKIIKGLIRGACLSVFYLIFDYISRNWGLAETRQFLYILIFLLNKKIEKRIIAKIATSTIDTTLSLSTVTLIRQYKTATKTIVKKNKTNPSFVLNELWNDLFFLSAVIYIQDRPNENKKYPKILSKLIVNTSGIAGFGIKNKPKIIAKIDSAMLIVFEFFFMKSPEFLILHMFNNEISIKARTDQVRAK